MTPLQMIEKWKRGCTHAGPEHDSILGLPEGSTTPGECAVCTEGLIYAMELKLKEMAGVSEPKVFEPAEKTGNVVIAGDGVFAGISDDPEEDALTEFKYAMVIEFDSAVAFGKALREGIAHFTVFEDRAADAPAESAKPADRL